MRLLELWFQASFFVFTVLEKLYQFSLGLAGVAEKAV